MKLTVKEIAKSYEGYWLHLPSGGGRVRIKSMKSFKGLGDVDLYHIILEGYFDGVFQADNQFEVELA